MAVNIERLIGSVVAIPRTQVDHGLRVPSGATYVVPTDQTTAVNIERPNVVSIQRTQVGGHVPCVPSSATYVVPTDQTTAVNIERPNVVSIQRTQAGGHGLCVPSGATYVVRTDYLSQRATYVNIGNSSPAANRSHPGLETIPELSRDLRNRQSINEIDGSQNLNIAHVMVESELSHNVVTSPSEVAQIESYITGNVNTESYITGNVNTESYITGNANTESCITGNVNTESCITGNVNTESCITGNVNTESCITGNVNTESYITGNVNTESYITGNVNTESYITGNANTESCITGNVNTEHYITGNVNTESYITGNVNTESYITGNANTERVSASQLHLVIRHDAINELTNRGFEREQPASNNLSGLASGGATYTPTTSGMINGKKENLETGDQHSVDVTSLTRIKNNNKQKIILMASRIRRWKSFDSCLYHIKDKQDLALAGLYYEGRGDCTRCFHCGGGLTNWEIDDDVWVEHAKWFPKCGYLLEQMGEKFILAVQELKAISEKITFLDVERRMAENMTARAAQLKCKKCHDRNIEVTFYGCGHMACYYCSHIDKNSPCHVCGREIFGRLQTKIK
ncbi:hypothetical protein Btru_003710 [Bulinus truncatus]|nr:hypothetical protein Btru_003710 [Bulinus truncatus]